MAIYTTLMLALPLAAFCEDARMSPSVLEPLAIGAATGFISDSPDVTACGMSAMGEVDDLKSAVLDLKNGIKSLNMTDIEAALHEFQAAMSGLPSVKTSCKLVGADVKTLIGALKQLPRQPKDLVIHLVINLFSDGDKIFGELSASEKAYRTDKDYMTSGRNLGMALRRTLVGEMNGTAPLPPMPKGAAEQLVAGMAMGFISDSSDVMACGMALAGELVDLKTAVDDVKKGITTLNMTEIEDAIKQVKAAINGSTAAKAKCKGVEADVAAIVQALKKIHGPKDLVIHIVDNLFNDGEPIFGGLAAAETAYKTGWDFMTAGRELGKVFRRLLVGEIHTDTMAAAPPSADLIV